MSLICAVGIFCSVVLEQFNIPDPYGYVSKFEYPGVLGTVLLAHSYNDGEHFYDLEKGSQLMYYAEGAWTEYVVREMLWMQALPSFSTQPTLIENEGRGESRSPSWIYKNVYNKHLVLQTCFTREDDPYWGRLFIIAEEVKQ